MKPKLTKDQAHIAKLEKRIIVLRGAIATVLGGLNTGVIKSQPLIDTSNPNAEEWPIKSLYEVLVEAMKK